MMKQIKVIDLSLDIQSEEIINLYKSSFSFFERVPIFIIKRRIKHKKFIMNKYIDNNELIGISVIFCYQKYILLHYIIISQHYKGKGYGSKILDLIKKENEDKIIFLSSEYYTDKNKGEEKERRINFYLKNEFIKNEFIVKEYGVKYFVMSNKKISKDEYLLVIRNCFNKIAARLFFK